MQSTRPGLAKLAQSARILKEFVHPFLQNWQPGMKTSLDYNRKVLPRTSGVGAKKQSRFEILQITASGAKICACVSSIRVLSVSYFSKAVTIASPTLLNPKS